MPEALAESYPSLFQIHEEFDMSPAKDFHNEFLFKISQEIDRILAGTDRVVKIDTFRYLEDWLINSFGDFKNALHLEKFVAGLKRFGAPKSFIKGKLDEYTGMGMISPGYAPDIFVTEKAQRHNEFGVPLLAMEIISRHSRETDLFYKPYFYETIGVEEYFVGEASIEYGKIIKAYRLVKGRYQPIAAKEKQYYSAVLGAFLPRILAL
jgi:hypothetical protein